MSDDQFIFIERGEDVAVESDIFWTAAGTVVAFSLGVFSLVYSNNRAHRAEARLEREEIERKGEDARKGLYERLNSLETQQGILQTQLKGHERLCESRDDALIEIKEKVDSLTDMVQDIRVTAKAWSAWWAKGKETEA